jgi:hypothetical protein
LGFKKIKMKFARDIALSNNQDLHTQNGDFQVADSDNVHIQHILTSHKGHYRQHPLCGAAISQSQNASLSSVELATYKKRIELQLRLDGYTLTELTCSGELNELSIQVNAHRN